MKGIICIALVFMASFDGTQSASKLRERFSWRSVDYAYPDDFTRQQAMLAGAFIPENNLPVGIEVWGNKIFVSVPRWRDGLY